MDPDNPHGLPRELRWQASSRYGNRYQTEADVREFYARARRAARINPPPPDDGPSDGVPLDNLPKGTIELRIGPESPNSPYSGPEPTRLERSPPQAVPPPRHISPTRLRRLYDLYGVPADTPLSDPSTPDPPRHVRGVIDVEYPDLTGGESTPPPSPSPQVARPVASEHRVSPRPSPSRSPRARGRPRSSRRLSNSRALPTRQATRNATASSASNAIHDGSTSIYGVKEHVYCDVCAQIISSSKTIQGHASTGKKVSEGDGVSVYVHEVHDEDIFEDTCNFGDTCNHHPTFGALRNSAKDGCHLCSLLAASDLVASDIPDSLSYKIRIVSAPTYDGPGWIEIGAEGYTPRKIMLSYNLIPRKDQGTLSSRRTDTDEIFKLAKGWLRTCLENHKSCHSTTTFQESAEFLPSRLLKVKTCGPYLLSVHLCLTDDPRFPDPPPPYLALSHCWGGASIIRLLTANLSDFLTTGIPLASLPQNFTDAALATARLGYTYLWIDSLCIIQDDPSDWDREAGTMGLVYSAATLTLAALGAKNSHGGCFVTRNPLSFTHCLLRGEGRDSVWAGNGDMLRGPEADGDLRPPLHKRGWVVQERALAPRTLSFGSQMVFWDCVEGAASELKPTLALKGNGVEGWGPPAIKATLFELKKQVQERDWDEWKDLWWNLVNRYTECRLTKDEDKWVAFSGLAGAVEDTARSRLYHGLWECNIFDELLWRADVPGRRIDIEAPSWSWLAVDEGVRAQRYNYDRDFRRVATVYIPQEGQKVVGQVSKKLSIRGRMLKLRWTVTRLEATKWEYSFMLQDGHSAYKSDWDGTWHPDVKPDDDWDLWALQFVSSEISECYGLVITPVDEEKKTWERVGFYGMSWSSDMDGDGKVNPRYLGEVETITLV